jgi:hypothetical protein
MRRIKLNILIPIFLIFFIFFLNCCEDVEKCIIPIHPNLIAKELKEGYISINYEENIQFEMEHADAGDYNISEITIEGNLPENISYKSTNKKIVLSGVPTLKGVYEFKITIKVSKNIYAEGNGELCSDTATQSYKISIN